MSNGEEDEGPPDEEDDEEDDVQSDGGSGRGKSSHGRKRATAGHEKQGSGESTNERRGQPAPRGKRP